MQNNEQKTIAKELISRYTCYLREQEKSETTIQKYVHDLTCLCTHYSTILLKKTMIV